MKLEIFIPVAIAIIFLASGCTTSSTSQNRQNQTTTSTSEVTSNLSQTYTNTKYNFTFQYPSTFYIESEVEGGGLPTVATNDTNQIMLYQSDPNQYSMVIGAGVALNPGFSQEGVENSLGTMSKYFTVTPIQIFGAPGFKVDSNGKDKSVKGEDYWVQNQGNIFHISLIEISTTTKDILSSFKFTK